MNFSREELFFLSTDHSVCLLLLLYFNYFPPAFLNYPLGSYVELIGLLFAVINLDIFEKIIQCIFDSDEERKV